MKIFWVFFLLSFCSVKGLNEYPCTSKYNSFIGICKERSLCSGTSFPGRCLEFGTPSSWSCCVNDTAVLPPYSQDYISESQFRFLFPRIASSSKVNNLFLFVNSALESILMDSPNAYSQCHRMAAFLTQISSESEGLEQLEEIGFGGIYDNREDLGNGPNDGDLFKGRGPLRLRGRNRYYQAGFDLNKDYETNPEQVALVSEGFRAAVWLWKKENLDDLATGTTFDFFSMTKIINSDATKLEERKEKWIEFMSVLGCDKSNVERERYPTCVTVSGTRGLCKKVTECTGKVEAGRCGGKSDVKCCYNEKDTTTSVFVSNNTISARDERGILDIVDTVIDAVDKVINFLTCEQRPLCTLCVSNRSIASCIYCGNGCWPRSKAGECTNLIASSREYCSSDGTLTGCQQHDTCSSCLEDSDCSWCPSQASCIAKVEEFDLCPAGAETTCTKRCPPKRSFSPPTKDVRESLLRSQFQIETFTTYQEIPIQRFVGQNCSFFFKTRMAVTSDGSPRAYHPDDIGIEFLARAGPPGAWTSIAYNKQTGQPFVQAGNEPFYVSTTSLQDGRYQVNDQRRYVDATKIPYVSMPSIPLVGQMNLEKGDIGLAYYQETKKMAFVILAEAQGSKKLGLGSVRLVQLLGYNPFRSGKANVGIPSGVTYVFFPGSGNRKPRTIEEINQIGQHYFDNCIGHDGFGQIIGEIIPSPPTPAPINSTSAPDDPTSSPTPSPTPTQIDDDECPPELNQRSVLKQTSNPVCGGYHDCFHCVQANCNWCESSTSRFCSDSNICNGENLNTNQWNIFDSMSSCLHSQDAQPCFSFVPLVSPPQICEYSSAEFKTSQTSFIHFPEHICYPPQALEQTDLPFSFTIRNEKDFPAIAKVKVSLPGSDSVLLESPLIEPQHLFTFSSSIIAKSIGHSRWTLLTAQIENSGICPSVRKVHAGVMIGIDLKTPQVLNLHRDKKTYKMDIKFGWENSNPNYPETLIEYRIVFEGEKKRQLTTLLFNNFTLSGQMTDVIIPFELDVTRTALTEATGKLKITVNPNGKFLENDISNNLKTVAIGTARIESLHLKYGPFVYSNYDVENYILAHLESGIENYVQSVVFFLNGEILCITDSSCGPAQKHPSDKTKWTSKKMYQWPKQSTISAKVILKNGEEGPLFGPVSLDVIEWDSSALILLQDMSESNKENIFPCVFCNENNHFDRQRALHYTSEKTFKIKWKKSFASWKASTVVPSFPFELLPSDEQKGIEFSSQLYVELDGQRASLETKATGDFSFTFFGKNQAQLSGDGLWKIEALKFILDSLQLRANLNADWTTQLWKIPSNESQVFGQLGLEMNWKPRLNFEYQEDNLNFKPAELEQTIFGKGKITSGSNGALDIHGKLSLESQMDWKVPNTKYFDKGEIILKAKIYKTLFHWESVIFDGSWKWEWPNMKRETSTSIKEVPNAYSALLDSKFTNRIISAAKKFNQNSDLSLQIQDIYPQSRISLTNLAGKIFLVYDSQISSSHPSFGVYKLELSDEGFTTPSLFQLGSNFFYEDSSFTSFGEGHTKGFLVWSQIDASSMPANPRLTQILARVNLHYAIYNSSTSELEQIHSFTELGAGIHPIVKRDQIMSNELIVTYMKDIHFKNTTGIAARTFSQQSGLSEEILIDEMSDIISQPSVAYCNRKGIFFYLKEKEILEMHMVLLDREGVVNIQAPINNISTVAVAVSARKSLDFVAVWSLANGEAFYQIIDPDLPIIDSPIQLSFIHESLQVLELYHIDTLTVLIGSTYINQQQSKILVSILEDDKTSFTLPLNLIVDGVVKSIKATLSLDKKTLYLAYLTSIDDGARTDLIVRKLRLHPLLMINKISGNDQTTFTVEIKNNGLLPSTTGVVKLFWGTSEGLLIKELGSRSFQTLNSQQTQSLSFHTSPLLLDAGLQNSLHSYMIWAHLIINNQIVSQSSYLPGSIQIGNTDLRFGYLRQTVEDETFIPAQNALLITSSIKNLATLKQAVAVRCSLLLKNGGVKVVGSSKAMLLGYGEEFPVSFSIPVSSLPVNSDKVRIEIIGDEKNSIEENIPKNSNFRFERASIISATENSTLIEAFVVNSGLTTVINVPYQIWSSVHEKIDTLGTVTIGPGVNRLLIMWKKAPEGGPFDLKLTLDPSGIYDQQTPFIGDTVSFTDVYVTKGAKLFLHPDTTTYEEDKLTITIHNSGNVTAETVPLYIYQSSTSDLHKETDILDKVAISGDPLLIRLVGDIHANQDKIIELDISNLEKTVYVMIDPLLSIKNDDKDPNLVKTIAINSKSIESKKSPNNVGVIVGIAIATFVVIGITISLVIMVVKKIGIFKSHSTTNQQSFEEEMIIL